MNSFHSDDNVKRFDRQRDGGMEGGVVRRQDGKVTRVQSLKKKNLGWFWRGNTEEKETLQIQTPLHFSEVLSTVPSILFFALSYHITRFVLIFF